MPKVKNDEFRTKSLVEIEEYAHVHPSEGGRLAAICGDTAAICLKEFVSYQVNKATSKFSVSNHKAQPEN
jgi:hypothetical protein